MPNPSEGCEGLQAVRGFIVFLRVGINPVAMGEIQLEFQLLRDLFSLCLYPQNQGLQLGITLNNMVAL